MRNLNDLSTKTNSTAKTMVRQNTRNYWASGWVGTLCVITFLNENVKGPCFVEIIAYKHGNRERCWNVLGVLGIANATSVRNIAGRKVTWLKVTSHPDSNILGRKARPVKRKYCIASRLISGDLQDVSAVSTRIVRETPCLCVVGGGEDPSPLSSCPPYYLSTLTHKNLMWSVYYKC